MGRELIRANRPEMRWLDGITHSMDMNLGKCSEIMRDRKPGGQEESDMTWQLNKKTDRP